MSALGLVAVGELLSLPSQPLIWLAPFDFTRIVIYSEYVPALWFRALNARLNGSAPSCDNFSLMAPGTNINAWLALNHSLFLQSIKAEKEPESILAINGLNMTPAVSTSFLTGQGSVIF